MLMSISHADAALPQVTNLSSFSAVNGGGYGRMLEEIAARVEQEGIAGFYPVGTTSVNITKRICDELLLSKVIQRALPRPFLWL